MLSEKWTQYIVYIPLTFLGHIYVSTYRTYTKEKADRDKNKNGVKQKESVLLPFYNSS